MPHIKMSDIELYVARYDKDQDRRLKFSEFAYSFAPLDPFYHDKIMERKASAAPMSDKTLMLYRNLWLTHMKIEQEVEVLRQRLFSRPSFSIHDAFRAIDENEDGKITKDELEAIILKSGFQISNAEIM
jgi:Ca2+-binding EF-hand superfamily protein